MEVQENQKQTSEFHQHYPSNKINDDLGWQSGELQPLPKPYTQEIPRINTI